MIHNIVIDNEGNEHQAVEYYLHNREDLNRCHICSLRDKSCLHVECGDYERAEKQDVIYKRKIKIGDIKR